MMRLLKIEKRLSLIPLLPLISLRPKTPKNVIEAKEKIVQPPGSLPPR